MTSVMPWHGTQFSEVLGRRDRLPHALLLHGRKGIGKLRFALALAHALLCEHPTPEGSCGACASCAWLQSGVHPDFRRLEPAVDSDSDDDTPRTKASTQIVIEQVRALSEFLFVSTHRGGWRPVIVHPAEALNPNAANALLKNLEEPPAHTLFILVSHRLHQLLPTIKSRCQLLPLPAPRRDQATAWLAEQGVEDAELAAAHTGHAPLLAMELQEQDYWAQRKRFLGHLAAPQIDVLTAAEQCNEAGIPALLEWLQKWTYDVASRQLTGTVRYNPDHEKTLSRVAAGCSPVRMLRFHRELVRMQRHAQHPLNVRLFLEQMLFAYAEVASPRAATT